jgi:hypothetical protein
MLGAPNTPLAFRCLYIADRLLDGVEFLGVFIRNLDTEFILDRHDQLDDVEAIQSKIIDEICFRRHLVRIDAQMFHNDFLYLFADVAHRPVPPEMATSTPEQGRPYPPPSWSYTNILSDESARSQALRKVKRNSNACPVKAAVSITGAV